MPEAASEPLILECCGPKSWLYHFTALPEADNEMAALCRAAMSAIVGLATGVARMGPGN